MRRRVLPVAVVVGVLLLVGAGYGLARLQSSPPATPLASGVLRDATPTADVPQATAPSGGQLLNYRTEDGIKVFELTAEKVRWSLLPDVSVVALAYNGQVPGPAIRATQGDTVRIILRNRLDEATTIHWHGIDVPNAMDGVPDVTQPPVAPGEDFTYEFTLHQAGTFMYHSHFEATQATRGLGGVFIVEPADSEATVEAERDEVLVLQEWGVDPQTGEPLGDMPGMPGMSVTNFFTINGKAFPATEPITVQRGERVRLRLVNFASEVPHPMHLHGQPFKVIAKDGYPWDGPTAVTQLVGSGETYDVLFVAQTPGTWLLHCHVPHHTTNYGDEPGGMMIQVVVQ